MVGDTPITRLVGTPSMIWGIAMSLRLFFVFAMLWFCTVACSEVAAAPPAIPRTMEELKELRLSQLYRREPRAREYIDKVNKKIAELRAGKSGTTDSAGRLETKLNEIIMNAGSISEDSLRHAVDLLADMPNPDVELTPAEAEDLRSQYAKICALLDDQIFIKDLEDTLVLHDRFVDHVLLRLWDKPKVDSELKRLEQSVSNAPPIPYGRLELLRGLQDKKIAPPANGCYIGVDGSDRLALSAYRPSVTVLEESAGATAPIDAVDFDMVDPAGQPVDLDKSNYRQSLISPPISLWMKGRLLEGHVPAITMRLRPPGIENTGKGGSEYGVQEILDGKLDDYLTRNLKLLAATKVAVMIGLLNAFDSVSDAAFGKDGKTPYYLLADPKLSAVPEQKRYEEVARRLKKGSLIKDVGAELRKYYGDPNVPDGPERVRDTWKHIRSLANSAGAQCISFYSNAGAFHGNRKALAEHPGAGAQDWNKLEYYWPGDGVLDWIGISPVQFDTVKTKNGVSIIDCTSEFMTQLRSSNWHSMPVLINDTAPAHVDPFEEDKWVSSWFQELLPLSYPEVKACTVHYPGQLTLWTPDALAAFRRCAGEKRYKVKLRLIAP